MLQHAALAPCGSTREIAGGQPLQQPEVILSRHADMRVENLAYDSGVLRATCSGEWDAGSDGNPSCQLLTETIQCWLDEHPQQRVSMIEVDYRDVDYTWGDGPVSSLVPFLQRDIKSFRLLPSPANRDALLSLVQSSSLPWFEVTDAPDA